MGNHAQAIGYFYQVTFVQFLQLLPHQNFIDGKSHPRYKYTFCLKVDPSLRLGMTVFINCAFYFSSIFSTRLLQKQTWVTSNNQTPQIFILDKADKARHEGVYALVHDRVPVRSPTQYKIKRCKFGGHA